jgi:TRIAD3 protein (E3 ubiquitin-protein ligase RNF216)
MQRCLKKDFPSHSEGYLRESLNLLHGLYAPTHVFLLENSRPGIKRPCNIFRTNGKHKELYDEEFDKEREWILEVTAENDECEDGIECGCCFAKFRFVSVVASIPSYFPPHHSSVYSAK